MTSRSSIRRLGAPLVVFFLTIWPLVAPVDAFEDAGKVGVVSFGLYGDQDVFRSEATGAAQVMAGRFETGPINVEYNSKNGGSATIEALTKSLQTAANRLDAASSRLVILGFLSRVWQIPMCWSSPRPMPSIRRSAARTRPSGLILATLFSMSRSGMPLA